MGRRTVPGMRRILIKGAVVGASIAALTLVGGIGSAAQAQTRATNTSPTGVLVRANSHQALPRHGGTVDSLNWSGYAVTPAADGITGVASTFVVPTAGLVPPGFAATWTGIGGYSTSDLIQAGIGEQSLPSTSVLGPQYYAWYELLPNSETQLTNCTGNSACPVAPGDKVTVDINSAGSSSSWDVKVVDSTEGWSWTLDNISYASSETSAEWILEAPTLVAQTIIAPVGTVAFGPTNTYTTAAGTFTIAQGNPTQIDLSPGLINEATPSALASDGQSFNDCAYAQTCPTP